MDVTKLTLFKMAKDRMDWSVQREQVLAANVANADTPHYRANDLQAMDFKKILRQQAQRAVQPRATMTNASHNPGTVPEKGKYQLDIFKKAYEVSPDGNTVVLEDQAAKMAETKGQYDLAINLFQKNLRMLRTAIGKNGG